jgi:hypothetical protein
MTTTTKPSEPVERAKSPIWGCPATTHTAADPPAIVLQLELATPSYEPVPKDPSNAYLNVPQQSWDLCHSPLDSIIDNLTARCEEKPIYTIRKAAKHSTYIYQRPLLPIKEYPLLEEFAARGWVDTGCKTKEGTVKGWDPKAEVPASVKCNTRK